MHTESSRHDVATRQSPLLLDDHARDELCRAVRDLDAAERCGHPLPLSQALVQVARCYAALGALEDAESVLAQALRHARLLATMDIAVEMLCELSELACGVAGELDSSEETRRAHAARERARDRAFEAAGLAAQVTDPQWEVKVLLRISDVLDRCGDHDDAVTMQTRALLRMNLEPAAESGGDTLRCASPQQLM